MATPKNLSKLNKKNPIPKVLFMKELVE